MNATDNGQGALATAREAPSLRTYALAAAAAACLRGTSVPTTPETGFLLAQWNEACAGGGTWAENFQRSLARPGVREQPLLRLAEHLGLDEVEILSVALAAAVEDDVLVGRSLAYLQAPLAGSRPTVGLLSTIFAGVARPPARAIDVLATGRAFRSGVLTLLGEGLPFPERAVVAPAHLCLALEGHDGAWPGASIGMGATPEVQLPESVLLEARRYAEAMAVSTERVLVLRSGSRAELKSVAAAVAADLKRRPLFIEADAVAGMGPWLFLRELLPVFSFELAPGERKQLPRLPYYDGPILALCGPDGTVQSDSGTALSWSLPVPPPGERRKLWDSALGNPELARELADHYRHGSGRIAHLGRLACHRSLITGREAPQRDDIVAVSRTGEGAQLESLAEPLSDAIPDEALVTTPVLKTELNKLWLRCRFRDGLHERLGVSVAARYRPGVRALFVGPSGTGKTLAAGWLATRLGLPLYRVDLASVTSKYIGETEKNLSRLLARAEQAEVVLLFDEADSLFGKRTEVKEANDRFANSQTNYLLQRIESFDGITILTSNTRGRFDSAFSRRLDMVLEFPLPGPEERRAMWLSHLGESHALSQKQLNQLAVAADLCGGHIRNAVLAAAVVARQGPRLIEYGDLLEGVAGEYRKLGRQMPVELNRRD